MTRHYRPTCRRCPNHAKPGSYFCAECLANGWRMRSGKIRNARARHCVQCGAEYRPPRNSAICEACRAAGWRWCRGKHATTARLNKAMQCAACAAAKSRKRHHTDGVFITAKELAAAWGCSSTTICDLARRGVIPAQQAGRNSLWRIPPYVRTHYTFTKQQGVKR